MEKRKHHESTIERVRMVRAITEQHYESGNQARCYKAVWRRRSLQNRCPMHLP